MEAWIVDTVSSAGGATEAWMLGTAISSGSAVGGWMRGIIASGGADAGGCVLGSAYGAANKVPSAVLAATPFSKAAMTSDTSSSVSRHAVPLPTAITLS